MKISDNTILITGGSSGIGLEIAKYFLRTGNDVIICSSHTDKMQSTQQENPGIIAYTADLTLETERVRLAELIMAKHPNLNILVNNAGIQLRAPLLQDTRAWSEHAAEIAINLEAPMHLCALFVPILLNKSSTIINVSSGLALTPACFAPVYCATKAGLHAYTRVLRKELESTSVEVMEIIPPAVNTQLGGIGLHDDGVDVGVFVASVMERLLAGEKEVGYGTSEESRVASRETLEARFESLNAR